MDRSSIRLYFISIFLLCLISFAPHGSATSIATFTDNNCKESYRNIDGPNGYPNGTCTELTTRGPFSSFQVVGEDDGCTVTIYGNDTDPDSPCSSTVLQFAEVATCYNASWIFYSIDSCVPPNVSPQSTGSPHSSDGTSPGAIAGAVIGAVVGSALVSGLVCFSILRRRGGRRGNPSLAGPQVELSDTGVRELGMRDEKREGRTGGPPQEMGRNSVYVAPAEALGQGVNPLLGVSSELPGDEGWRSGGSGEDGGGAGMEKS